MWRKGVRVLTAGGMQVKRDRRIALRGTDLQITGEKARGGSRGHAVATATATATAVTATTTVVYSKNTSSK